MREDSISRNLGFEWNERHTQFLLFCQVPGRVCSPIGFDSVGDPLEVSLWEEAVVVERDSIDPC